MPRFLDHHPMPQVSPQMMQQQMQMMEQMKADIKAHRADPNGVVPVNVFMGANGEAWCLSEAASADAVVKAHASHGVTLSAKDVVEVSSLV
ncbi:MAG: hypothetical protein HYX92_07695 [Chloroflexi bacterium]|nr:hypothetical protein [Chloroflexota bacterium]